MHDYSFLLTIGLALLVGAMSPGPSFVVVAQSALAKSRQHGLATAVGTGLGAAVFALLAGLGVTALLETSPILFLGVSLIGALYLFWIAIKIARHAHTPLAPAPQIGDATSSLFRAVLKGFAVQISNPKTVFVIAGIFSALMPINPPELTALWVAIIAFIVDFGWYAIVAISLSVARSRALYQRAKVYLDYMAVLLLVALSAKLIYETTVRGL